jgi:hypothetical protein
MEPNLYSKIPTNPEYKKYYEPVSFKTLNEMERVFDDMAIRFKSSNTQKKKESTRKREENFQDWCEYYLADHLQYRGKFQKFHPLMLEYAQYFLTNNEDGLSQLRIFRGAGKTTLLFCLLLYKILTGTHCIMYVSKTERRAIECVYDLRLALLTNQRLMDDYNGPFNIKSAMGDIIITNTLGMECFVGSYGCFSQVRGVKFRNWRPQIIACDDIDDIDVSINEERFDKLITWFNSELYNCTAMEHHITMLGNVFHKNMLLIKASEMDGCKTYTLKALDNNDQSNYPERFPNEWLYKRRKILTPLFFNREFQHEINYDGEYFSNKHMHFSTIEDALLYTKTVIFMDGSFTVNGDTKAIIVLQVAPNNTYYVEDMLVRNCSTELALMFVADKQKELIAKEIYPIFYFDATFYQNEYTMNAIREIERMTGVFISAVPVKELKNKTLKIEMLTAYYNRDLFSFNEKLKNSDDYQKGIEQLYGWRPKTSGHDDFPDCMISAVLQLELPLDENSKVNYDRISEERTNNRW